MNVLCLIPARGGSKGLPNKNIKSFLSKPLIEWTIEIALQCEFIDKVIVSTDSDEIAYISSKAGADIPFKRPSNLALDTSPAINVVMHALKYLDKYDHVVVLQPTSPLRSLDDLNSAFNLYINNESDSLVSICKASKHPSWSYFLGPSNELIPFDSSKNYICRQDFVPTYFLNGAIYINSREFIFNQKAFINENTIGYIMPEERSIDIDSDLDFKIAEFLKTTQMI